MELLESLVSYGLRDTKLSVHIDLELVNWESKVAKIILNCFLEVFSSSCFVVLATVIGLLVNENLVINLFGLSALRILWDTNTDLIDSIFLEMKSLNLISVLIKNGLNDLVSVYNILVHVMAENALQSTHVKVLKMSVNHFGGHIIAVVNLDSLKGINQGGIGCL